MPNPHGSNSFTCDVWSRVISMTQGYKPYWRSFFASGETFWVVLFHEYLRFGRIAVRGDCSVHLINLSSFVDISCPLSLLVGVSFNNGTHSVSVTFTNWTTHYFSRYTIAKYAKFVWSIGLSRKSGLHKLIRPNGANLAIGSPCLHRTPWRAL